MATSPTEADVAARLIERLLADPSFRARFRRDPAGACREAGLDHFVHMIDTFIAIGLGVLVGNALVLRFTRGPSSAPPARARSARAGR